MTVTLPQNLEEDVARRAEELGVVPDEVVRRAVTQFLYVDPELRAELDDWQRATWKAWSKVEESVK